MSTSTAEPLQQHLTLEQPRSEFADSYRGLVREFVDRGELLIPFTLSFATEPFSALLEALDACSRGEGIPADFVPHSTFWLVRNGAEVVGVSNLRHRLTDALRHEGGNVGYGVRPSARRSGFGRLLLRHTLDRARAVGLSEVLLTCGASNLGSVRTILGNGGSLLSEEYIPARGEIVRRYRIDL